MALFTSIFASPFSVASPIGRCPLNTFKRFTHPIIASSLSSPSSPESKSSSAPSQTVVSSTETSANAYPASSRPPEPSFNYAFANGSLFAWFAKSVESSIERTIFDFPFLALLAVGGSLAVLRLVEAIGKFSEFSLYIVTPICCKALAIIHFLLVCNIELLCNILNCSLHSFLTW